MSAAPNTGGGRQVNDPYQPKGCENCPDRIIGGRQLERPPPAARVRIRHTSGHVVVWYLCLTCLNERHEDGSLRFSTGPADIDVLS